MNYRSGPTTDLDLYSDEALLDPYPGYAELRRLGGAVWLNRYEVWALPRWDSVTAAARDHKTFSSADGVGYTPLAPNVVRSTIQTDEPLHGHLRRVVADKLLPSAVRQLEQRIEEEATSLVDDVVTRTRFDAVREFAWRLPLTVVTELVGVPPELGQRMLQYSESRGNSFGPPSLPRTQDGLAKQSEFSGFVADLIRRENLRPGSMGWNIYAAADRGEIELERAPALMRDYIGPSLDTTISGTGNLFWLLAKNPDQWRALRDDPSLIPTAIDEGLRLESPIQFFIRRATEDTEFAGATIRAGERVLLMFGSANRDEQRWPEANRMDVRRKGLQAHVAFGFGVHSCAGRGLALMEMRAIYTHLVQKAREIKVLEAQRRPSNGSRSFTRLDARIVPAQL